MKVFLVGISCVGKTTIGKKISNNLGYDFFDLDHEIETYFGQSISQIQSQFLGNYSYRKHVSIVLRKIIQENKDFDYIVALPPSGLSDAFLRVLKTGNERIVIALHDSPENLIKRITFYDANSKKIEKELTEREKKLHLREFKLDNTYFNRAYKRADYNIDIDGLTIMKCVAKVIDLLKKHKDEELFSN